jgi:hypothetical protein
VRIETLYPGCVRKKAVTTGTVIATSPKDENLISNMCFEANGKSIVI